MRLRLADQHSEGSHDVPGRMLSPRHSLPTRPIVDGGHPAGHRRTARGRARAMSMDRGQRTCALGFTPGRARRAASFRRARADQQEPQNRVDKPNENDISTPVWTGKSPSLLEGQRCPKVTAATAPSRVVRTSPTQKAPKARRAPMPRPPGPENDSRQEEEAERGARKVSAIYAHRAPPCPPPAPPRLHVARNRDAP